MVAKALFRQGQAFAGQRSIDAAAANIQVEPVFALAVCGYAPACTSPALVHQPIVCLLCTSYYGRQHDAMLTTVMRVAHEL